MDFSRLFLHHLEKSLRLQVVCILAIATAAALLSREAQVSGGDPVIRWIKMISPCAGAQR
jgi:hypothetical protein